ncbi:FKBP-type peptidyl-prolyl cis-trans isomerase [Nocardiopsis baichengensis]|uniref:FKBP-type peptidyl-prolyl cis-trans isomerase n=1 Tax=Nocardiopsis baichengensis TaxID=280240 RepID=UPI000475FDA3|nr:FKBP-type peptidyl-prolyl cis-trans isomerase [Nocardiopsis baichengensis]
MRRRAAALAVPFSAVLLAVSACGTIPEDWKTPAFLRTGDDVDSRLPTVSGDRGEEPKVDFPDIAPPGEQISGVVRPGEEQGEIVRADDLLLVDIVDYQWTDKGKTEKTNSTYETETPFLLSMEQLGEEFNQDLVNQNVGAQVVFVFPAPDPEQAQAQGADPDDIPEGDSVSVLEVRDRFGKGDTVPGEQTTDGGEGLPTATDNGAAEPDISIPDGDPPKDLETTVLVEGDGPEVEDEQEIVAQYTGVRWEDGEVFDSTWSKGGAPFTFPLGQGQVIEGWDEGLKGQKVGSRVMLVVPEDQAYGKEAEDNGQPAGTLVFVIDILGAVDPPPPAEEESGSEEGDGGDTSSDEGSDDSGGSEDEEK